MHAFKDRMRNVDHDAVIMHNNNNNITAKWMLINIKIVYVNDTNVALYP